jgi:hemerythrin superfamily protein
MAKRTQQAATKERQGDKGRQRAADALEMLRADHHRVSGMFDRFESADEAERKTLATQIFQELEIHSRLEEEFFYPALEKTAKRDESAQGNGRQEAVVETENTAEEDDDEDDDEDEEDDMDEEETAEEEMDLEDILAIAREEHEAVNTTIGELRKMGIEDEKFKERFEELKEDVLSHASEEEEVIFPVAQARLDIEALGKQMHERKQGMVGSKS